MSLPSHCTIIPSNTVHAGDSAGTRSYILSLNLTGYIVAVGVELTLASLEMHVHVLGLGTINQSYVGFHTSGSKNP